MVTRKGFQEQYPYLYAILLEMGRSKGPFALKDGFDPGPTYMLGMCEEVARTLTAEERTELIEYKESYGRADHGKITVQLRRHVGDDDWLRLKLLGSWIDWIYEEVWNLVYIYGVFVSDLRR